MSSKPSSHSDPTSDKRSFSASGKLLTAMNFSGSLVICRRASLKRKGNFRIEQGWNERYINLEGRLFFFFFFKNGELGIFWGMKLFSHLCAWFSLVLKTSCRNIYFKVSLTQDLVCLFFFPMAYLARLIFQQLLFFSSICLTPSPFHTQKQMVRPFSGSTGACNRVGQRWLQAWSPPF